MPIVQNSRRSSQLISSQQRRHIPDYKILIISVVLLVAGLIVIYGISPGLSVQKHVSENYFATKQLIAVLLGVIAFIITANTPLELWKRLQRPLIVITILASIAVRISGEKVNGAYRWIQIGGLSFQPVELIKFAMVIWLAGFLVQQSRTEHSTDNWSHLKPIFVAFLLVGFAVGILQSDLGSLAVIMAIMFSMCFTSGIPLRKISILFAVLALLCVLLISSSPYRRQRFVTFIHPQSDCQDAGYQACQALIAVGSGGIYGKGLAHDVQAYGYLPEAANDSIFAIFAEKFGFIGVTILVCLFMVLFTRLKNIIEHTTDIYSKLLVVGVLAWLSSQTFINIGAMIGLLPLKGITLPFVSYGGTSVVFVAAAIGIGYNISRYTSYRIQTLPERANNDNSSQRWRYGRSRNSNISRRS